MLFHKASKTAFVCPTKVGTFTIAHFLRSVGWKSLGPPHQFFDSLVKQYPNLLDYKVYGFFRNPLSRFESALLHIKQMPFSRDEFQKVLNASGLLETVESVSYDQAVDIFPAIDEKFKVLFNPQTAWFTHNNIEALDFESLESELRRVSGNYEQPMKRYNTSTDFGRSEVTQKVKEFVRDYYAADYQFAKEVLGKEY